VIHKEGVDTIFTRA